jgi:protein-disulfide isomerase
VYASRFGTAFGVPVSVFGAIWFTGGLLLLVGGEFGSRALRDNVPGYLFALSTVALGVVLYLGYASFFILKTVCPLCLMTYAAVIGLYVISGAAMNFPMTTLPRRAASDVRHWIASPVAIALTVLFFAGAASAIAFFPREGGGTAEAAPAPSQEQRSELERFLASAPRVPLVIPAEGAKVLIVKFNDFQCPACGHSYLTYKPILAKYEAEHPGAVRVVLKDYPLNSQCNLDLTTPMHPAACEAAVAVRLAKAHNREEAMEEWLYTHQPSLTPAAVRQAARDIGQVNDFDAKYASTLELVKGDIALGHQLQVRSTPTFFINGVKVEGEWAPQYFDQAIAYELQRTGAK